MRLALMLLGIEHLMGDAFLAQHAGDELGGFDRGGADEHGLLALRTLADIFDDRLEFVALGEVHEVRQIFADHLPVGRDDVDLKVVDLQEFRRLGVGRTGHA